MKIVALFLAFVASSFSCTGSRFFSQYGSFFWDGFDSLCFESTPEEVRTYLNNNIKTIEQGYSKFRPKKDLEVWSDSASLTTWWWGNEVTTLNTNQFSHGYVDPGKYDLGYLKSYMAGIYNIYVGNKKTKDTVLAFTFYNGNSPRFQKLRKGKYTNNTPAFGLFSISINYEMFKENYLTRLMDGVGFGRVCTGEISNNCFEYNNDGMPGNAGGRIVVDEPDVSVSWGRGDLFRIKLFANYGDGMRRAIHDNVLEYCMENRNKYPALKSN